MIRTPFGEIRHDGDVLAVVFERDYAATPDEIWAALTTPARLARWFARAVGTLAPGHTVELVMGDAADEMGTFRIDVCDRPHRIEGLWTWPDEHPTTLRVTLAPGAAGGTRVTLDHTGFDPKSTAGYGCGWHHYIDSLDAHIRGENPPDFADYYPALLDTYRAAVAKAAGGTA